MNNVFAVVVATATPNGSATVSLVIPSAAE
jgi:hypothetical protein